MEAPHVAHADNANSHIFHKAKKSSREEFGESKM
jgi:hypothetical protein